METWEIYDATPDEIKLVREWARKRPVVTERGETETNYYVHCEDSEREDELAELCDAYSIKSRLL
jgi:hypothetical protein